MTSTPQSSSATAVVPVVPTEAMISSGIHYMARAMEDGHDRTARQRIGYEAMLAAASPAVSQGVRVKALVWQNFEDSHWAESLVGTYNLEQDGLGQWYWTGDKAYEPANSGAEGVELTLDEAKAAAQSDYERRILAALEQAPAGEAVAAGAYQYRYPLQGYAPGSNGIAIALRREDVPSDAFDITWYPIAHPAPDETETLRREVERLGEENKRLWSVRDQQIIETEARAATAERERDELRTALVDANAKIERMAEALRQAAQTFEAIRQTLVNNLEEPERSAFWYAVTGRNATLAETAPNASADQAGSTGGRV